MTSTENVVTESTLCDPAELRQASTKGDVIMRRLLRLPLDGPPATKADAEKAFQQSILVAAVRCTLMYVVFPFVLPVIGVASGVGPLIGIPVSLLAIVAISMSIRRFWRADHSKRWHYTVIGGVTILFMFWLLVKDVNELLP
jgi:hypothetical protein